MPLLQLRQLTLKYGAAPLLDRVDFQVEPGERVCLLGRNGAGKTSLMRIITGEETPNEGELILSDAAKVTRLIQEIPDDIAGSVMEVLHSGLRPDRHEEEWQTDIRLDDLAAEMQLPTQTAFASLSGGMKRRVLLARALAEERVAFVPGAPFFAAEPETNTLRLSYSLPSDAGIEAGTERLGRLIRRAG